MKEKKNKNEKQYIMVIMILAIFILSIFWYQYKNEKVYTLKEFYPDNKLSAIHEYVLRNGDTILNGKFTRYNKNGKMIATGTNLNGEPHGKATYYYDNGVVESVFFRKNSELSEESFEYNKNGEIKRYIMYDPFGSEAFIARFDDMGNIESYEGYPIMEIYQYKFQENSKHHIAAKQNLKVGDTLLYKYLIPNIPNAKKDFILGSIGGNATGNKVSVKNISTVQRDYREVLTKTGLKTVRAIINFKFDNTEKTVISDTLTFSVFVH